MEIYLDPALAYWLPAARVGTPEKEAMIKLANQFMEQTGDPFLLEMVSVPEEHAGLRLLSEAIIGNRTARPLEGISKAAMAEERLSLYQAAKLRAMTERVYGQHRAAQGANCLAGAIGLEKLLLPTSYRWMLAQTILERAVCEAYQGQLSKAMDTASLASQIAATAHLPSLEMRAQGMVSSFLNITGNSIVPWRLIPIQLDRYWANPYPPNHAHQFYADLSGAAARQGLASAAVVFAQWAVDAIGQTGEILLESIGRDRLSSLAIAAGDAGLAASEHAKAEALFTRVPDSPLKREFLFDATLYRAAQEDNPQKSIPLLNRIGNSSFPTASMRIRWFETTALAYYKGGDARKAKAAAEDALGMHERIQTPLPESGRPGVTEQTARVFRMLSEIQLKGGDSGAAFATWEAYRSSGFKQRAAPWKPSEAGEQYIGFATMPSGAVVWLWNGSKLESFPLSAGLADIGLQVRRLREMCGIESSSRQEIEAGVSWLRNSFPSALKDRLAASRLLLIDAEGIFANIPFAVVFPEHVVVRIHGLEEYQRRAGLGKVHSSDSLLLVASPELAKEIVGLYKPNADASMEGAGVSRRFSSVVTLEGSKANAPALLEEMQRAVVFHYSGHGSANAGNGALMLSPTDPRKPYSGIFSAREIANHRWKKCRLAVLSACSTGAGESAGTYNPESLVQSFLRAGVGRVLAGSWNVNAQATREFMDIFYGELLSGVLPSQALWKAQTQLRRKPATSHPYFWGAFELFGYL